MADRGAKKAWAVNALAGWLAMCGGIPLAMAQPVQPLPAHTAPVPLDAPSAVLTNGQITARIYLIDGQRGFYRGTRFDQAGVIGSLILGKQDFYGPWFDRVSPEVADFAFTPQGIVGGPDSAISGPVEEFAPMGFDAAAPDTNFLKIGVGLLKKPDAKPYDHYRLYDIADPGKRTTKVTGSAVTFTQSVAQTASGYGFRYVKTLRLVPGRPQMRIEHVLTNTGTKPFTTSVYDHNFLKLSPGNAAVGVTLPFPVTADPAPDPAIVRIAGGHIAYRRPLTGNTRVSFLISGFSDGPGDYDIRVDDHVTGAGMRVTADQPLSKMNLWSIRSVMAVEPYIAITLAPGASKRWVYTYTYKAPAAPSGH